jgi:hypothetical protein
MWHTGHYGRRAGGAAASRGMRSGQSAIELSRPRGRCTCPGGTSGPLPRVCSHPLTCADAGDRRGTNGGRLEWRVDARLARGRYVYFWGRVPKAKGGGCTLAPPPHVDLPDSGRRHRQTHGLSIMAHPHIHAHTLPPVDDSRPPPHGLRPLRHRILCPEYESVLFWPVETGWIAQPAMGMGSPPRNVLPRRVPVDKGTPSAEAAVVTTFRNGPPGRPPCDLQPWAERGMGLRKGVTHLHVKLSINCAPPTTVSPGGFEVCIVCGGGS